MPAMTAWRKLTFDLTCNVTSDLQIKFLNIFRNVIPGAKKRIFGSIIGPVIWQIIGVGAKMPLPPKKAAGRVWKYPNGERINKTLYATPDRDRSRQNFVNPSSDTDSERTVDSDSVTLIRRQICEFFRQSPAANHLTRVLMGTRISHHLMGGEGGGGRYRTKRPRQNTLHLIFRWNFVYRVILGSESHCAIFRSIRVTVFKILPRAFSQSSSAARSSKSDNATNYSLFRLKVVVFGLKTVYRIWIYYDCWFIDFLYFLYTWMDACMDALHGWMLKGRDGQHIEMSMMSICCHVVSQWRNEATCSITL